MRARVVQVFTNNSSDPNAHPNASGAGPIPMLTGTQASTSADGLTVDLSADNPDLSAVAADGSHVIRLYNTNTTQTNVSPQYVAVSRILAVDNVAKTITVENPLIQSATGQGWSIGGKVDISTSISALNDSFRAKRGPWTLQIEYTGIDYTISSKIDDTYYQWDDPEAGSIGENWAYDAMILEGVGGKPTLVVTVNAIGINVSRIGRGGRRPFIIRNFVIKHTSSRTYGYQLVDMSHYGRKLVENCEFYLEDAGVLSSGVRLGYGDGWVRNCVFRSGATAFIGADGSMYAHNCVFDGCTTGCNHYDDLTFFISRCIFRNCQYGVKPANYYRDQGIWILGNTFDSCDYPVWVQLYENATIYAYSKWVFAVNNIFYGTGAYHLYVDPNPPTTPCGKAQYNYGKLLHQEITFYGNAYGPATSGKTNDQDFFFPMGEIGVVSFTEDPFVDRINGNYALNDAPGGGKLLKEAGWPQTWPGLPNTTSYPDVGAVQSKKSSKPLVVPSTARTKWWV